MWKAIAASVAGTSHVENGKACDDSSLIELQSYVGGQYLIAVCCDGAGSASHASIGSALSCEVFRELASAHLASQPIEEAGARVLATSWCSEIRRRLEERATELDVPVRELACTLLAAILGENGALFMQIGDGAMVVRDEQSLSVVFWPQSGEFVNTTNFLCQDNFEAVLEVDFRRGQVREFAAFSDGLERLALRFADRTVHEPFFERLWTPLRGPRPQSEFIPLLRDFLDSPAVNQRTDDDKSLILAVWIDDVDDPTAR